MAVEKQIFNYKALDNSGTFVEGKMKAYAADDVTDEIVKRGFTPLEVEETNVFSRDISFKRNKIKPKEVAVFARQFSTMSEAAVPIVKSLDILQEQTSNVAMQEVIKTMKLDISNGSTLADSLEKHPTVFSQIMISMVRAGEAGGFLNKTLLSVAEGLESEVRLRAKVKSAMTYPVVVFVLAILMCTGMLLFIVPIFAKMFKSLGGQLPIPTQILVGLSNFLIYGGGFAIAAVAIVGTVMWNRNKHKRAVREFIDPLKLKLPVFGKLTTMIIMARFARNFGNLLDAAVPIIPVLDIVGTTTGSTVVEKSLLKVKESILAGGTVAKPMGEDKIFPKMLVEMTAIGEDAGDMPNMLAKVATAYDEDVEAITSALTSLMEPIMIIVLGAIVGSMIVALYLPIFSIYDLVKGPK